MALPVVGAEDPPGVLQEASLAGDGRGEEQGVQRRAVEPLSRVRPGSHGEQRRPARLRDEPGERGSTVFGPHAALEDDRVVAQRPQCAGDRLQVAGPAGEDKAVLVLVDGSQARPSDWSARKAGRPALQWGGPFSCPHCPKRAGYFPSFPDRVLNPC